MPVSVRHTAYIISTFAPRKVFDFNYVTSVIQIVMFLVCWQ